jgi:polyhydroxyalkanoate synthase
MPTPSTPVSRPKTPTYTEDKLVLYRYQRPADVVQQPVPLLVIYALVNRPYMTDIQENRSTIKGLLATGQDVYLIDWGYPDQADCSLTLDDYINGYIDRCVDYICESHGSTRSTSWASARAASSA